MNNIVVMFEGNWSDEFDVHGFMVTTEEEWQELQDIARVVFEHRGVIEYYFGTNEAMTWESFDDYIRCFTVRPVSEEQAEYIKNLFGDVYGNCLVIDREFSSELGIGYTDADLEGIVEYVEEPHI